MARHLFRATETGRYGRGQTTLVHHRAREMFKRHFSRWVSLMSGCSGLDRWVINIIIIIIIAGQGNKGEGAAEVEWKNVLN